MNNRAIADNFLANIADFSSFTKSFDFCRKMISLCEKLPVGKNILNEDGRFDELAKDAYQFIYTIENFSLSTMAITEYATEAARLWNKLARFRKLFKPTDQFISSIPSTLFGGMFCHVPEMREDINIVVGTEMRCLAGISEDNLPIFKNQDVALGIRQPALGRDKTIYLPLLFGNVKKVTSIAL